MSGGGMAKLGRRVTIVSAILAALCVAPIMLYAAFGPEDGNPVGLGLLMVFGSPVFGAATLIGAIIWLIAIARASYRQATETRSHDE